MCRVMGFLRTVYTITARDMTFSYIEFRSDVVYEIQRCYSIIRIKYHDIMFGLSVKPHYNNEACLHFWWSVSLFVSSVVVAFQPEIILSYTIHYEVHSYGGRCCSCLLFWFHFRFKRFLMPSVPIHRKLCVAARTNGKRNDTHDIILYCDLRPTTVMSV